MRGTTTISMCGQCFLGMSVIAGVATLALCQQGEDLLALVKAGHRANRDSIRTFSATILVDFETPDKKRAETMKCSYWRTTAAVRSRETYPDGRIEDSVQTRSEHKQVGKRPQPDGTTFQDGAFRGPAV